MNVHISVGHHVGAVALTGIQIVTLSINERIHVIGSSQGTLHQLSTNGILIVKIIIHAIGRAKLHTRSRCTLIRRVLRTAVCQLEVDTGINPLVNLVVNIGTQRITVSTTTLFPLVTVVGITYTEAGTGFLVTAAKGNGMTGTPSGRFLE